MGVHLLIDEQPFFAWPHSPNIRGVGWVLGRETASRLSTMKLIIISLLLSKTRLDAQISAFYASIEAALADAASQ